ncbi:transcription elongation factor GreB [bacterium]|nr:transcription elongation factor GreB [bacterium]
MKQKLYITPETYAKLRDELSFLLKTERSKIVKAVTDAAAMGDRSENAEYIYGKRRLREIDRRVRFLQKRLSTAEIVDSSTLDTSKIAFGLSTKLRDSEGQHYQYRIVGPDDVDPTKGYITYNSPIGKSLLGKSIGDELTVQRPKGSIELEVLEIFLETEEPSSDDLK